MKAFLLVVSLFATSLAFAETKPTNSLVPTMCGQNTLESVAGPDYPSEVCTYSITASPYALAVVGIVKSTGTEYYVVVGVDPIPGSSNAKWSLAKANVTQVGNYPILNGWEKSVSLEITSYIDSTSGNPSLSGELFDVQLEIVFVTL